MIDSVHKFYRRIAANCLDLWNRDETIAAVQRIGEEHEAGIVSAIEQLQMERLGGYGDG
jgi:hypothetical protein